MLGVVLPSEIPMTIAGWEYNVFTEPRHPDHSKLHDIFAFSANFEQSQKFSEALSGKSLLLDPGLYIIFRVENRWYDRGARFLAV